MQTIATWLAEVEFSYTHTYTHIHTYTHAHTHTHIHAHNVLITFSSKWSAFYVCLICLLYMSLLCVCLVCLPYMHVCLICLALYVCLICLPCAGCDHHACSLFRSMSALYVCLICLPYMSALYFIQAVTTMLVLYFAAVASALYVCRICLPYILPCAGCDHHAGTLFCCRGVCKYRDSPRQSH